MVIQRWQSVLLLCVCALMACFSFASIGQIQTPDLSFDFTSMGISYEGESTDGASGGYLLHTWYFFALTLMSSVLPLIAIFFFKNLRMQMKLCLVEILFIIAVCTVTATLGYGVVEDGAIGWSTVICCPVLSLVATVMAYNRINHDRKLLLSMDRLR